MSRQDGIVVKGHGNIWRHDGFGRDVVGNAKADGDKKVITCCIEGSLAPKMEI